MLCNFHEFFEIGIYIYKKHDTFHHVRFLHTKSQTLQKKQYNLRDVFIYMIFMEFLKLAEGGGNFYIQRTVHFALYLYMQKTMHFVLRFYIKK